jgi:uncharacterized phage infection (PIP) family protein YhgE
MPPRPKLTHDDSRDRLEKWRQGHYDTAFEKQSPNTSVASADQEVKEAAAAYSIGVISKSEFGQYILWRHTVQAAAATEAAAANAPTETPGPRRRVLKKGSTTTAATESHIETPKTNRRRPRSQSQGEETPGADAAPSGPTSPSGWSHRDTPSTGRAVAGDPSDTTIQATQQKLRSPDHAARPQKRETVAQALKNLSTQLEELQKQSSSTASRLEELQKQSSSTATRLEELQKQSSSTAQEIYERLRTLEDNFGGLQSEVKQIKAYLRM